MKTTKFFSLLLMLVFVPVFMVSAQNFSGEWKINKEKLTVVENQLVLSKITIQLKADSLMTTRVYENGMGEEFPFDENLTLDGKECKIVIYEMPRTSKASRTPDGAITIASATTFYGNSGEEDMVAKETWKVDNEGKTLTLEFSNTMSGVESTGTYIYDKAN
jgi:hypothetical protein